MNSSLLCCHPERTRPLVSVFLLAAISLTAINTATSLALTVPEPLGPSSRRTGLAIPEIMYHPLPRQDGRNLEFIEWYNSEPVPAIFAVWRDGLESPPAGHDRRSPFFTSGARRSNDREWPIEPVNISFALLGHVI
jgi:hypothetical protein